MSVYGKGKAAKKQQRAAQRVMAMSALDRVEAEMGREEMVDGEFARGLARELDEAHAEIARLRAEKEVRE